MPKLLGEFLQEQQEPFTLDVYLLERGYCTRTKPNVYSRCSQKKRRQAIPNCAEFVGAVFSRILLHNNSKKIKDPRKKETSDVEADDDANHEHEFSSASTTTLYNSCSESDVEDADYSSREAEADTNCFNLRSMEDCDKQLSPILVLEETESEASPLHQKQYNFKKTNGESSKFPQRKSKHKTAQKFEECMNSYEQYIVNKRALQQTKMLLVDCVREVIENKRKRDDGGGKQLKKILGADELWKAVCENVWLWSQEPIHEKNTLHILKCDFMASLEEWDSDSCLQKREVSMEIGDAILEDIINETVTC